MKTTQDNRMSMSPSSVRNKALRGGRDKATIVARAQARRSYSHTCVKIEATSCTKGLFPICSFNNCAIMVN